MACLTPFLLLILCFSSLAALPILAAEEDPLQDFCVADPNNTQITINGFLCKPISQVQSSDFRSSLLRQPRNLLPNLGAAVNLASASSFPALNTQGLSIARIDFLPKGLNPPHEHPRATEVLFLVKGRLVVGFAMPGSNKFFQQTLDEGDLFVFPRGLVHFQLNPDEEKSALSISAFNSQNAGTAQVAAALFAAQPPLPKEVLETAFGIEQGDVDRLIASVGKTLAT